MRGRLDATFGCRGTLGAALIALALLMPTAATASASAVPPADAHAAGTVASDLLPDVRLYRLYGLVIETTGRGRKRLRFGTRAFNIGDGPLEVRGTGPVDGEMTQLEQWIADDQGGRRMVEPQGAAMFWRGDGHEHWHVARFINVELFRRGELSSTRRIRKIGFCLIDLIPSANPPPATPAQRVYELDACGTSRNMDITMGISVGYADDYHPWTAHQWIDVTTLPRGVYRLCAKVNPLGHWLESNTANNFYWHDLFVDPALNKVVRLDSGRTKCGTYRNG